MLNPTMLYNTDKIKIELAEGSAATRVIKFSGTIDDANPGEFLDPILEKLHAELLAENAQQVEANFVDLGFLNSSGIKSLIKWVMKQMELAPEKRYQICFLYSPKVTWQQTSLRAITHLSRGSVTVQPV